MKESIKIIILVILVAFFGLFVATTKGNNVVEAPKKEIGFSYEISQANENGIYKNDKDNGRYIMLGKNNDGSYLLYFIYDVAGKKTVQLENNSVNFIDKKAKIKNKEAVDIEVQLKENSILVPKTIGYGDATLEGNYTKEKSISKFSLSEFD